jgi:hypothetical protein
VALAVWTAVRPPPPKNEVATAESEPLTDIAAALGNFERGYEAEFGSNYLAILDQEMQELPVVEF